MSNFMQKLNKLPIDEKTLNEARTYIHDLEETLEACMGYFDDRADVDGVEEDGSVTYNVEMHLWDMCHKILGSRK